MLWTSHERLLRGEVEWNVFAVGVWEAGLVWFTSDMINWRGAGRYAGFEY